MNVASAVNEESASTRRLGLLQYAGVLTTFVTAAGYLIGYVSVGSAANRLGVSTHDLGLTFTDYLLVPAWSYLAVAIGGICFWVYDRWQDVVRARHPRGLGQRLVTIGLDFVVSVVLLGVLLGIAAELASASDLGGVLGLMNIYIMLGIASLVIPLYLSQKRLWAIGIVVVLIGVTAALTIRTSIKWADDVRAYARTGKDQPTGWFTPGRAVSPQIGQACRGASNCKCVVRLGDRVLLGIHGSLVVKEIDEFRPRACKVVDDP